MILYLLLRKLLYAMRRIRSNLTLNSKNKIRKIYTPIEWLGFEQYEQTPVGRY
jgi:hypothetical protein